MHAVIAGDVVAYTSLAVEDRVTLERSLDALLADLEAKTRAKGWIAKGDFLELYVREPARSLRVMLAIKTHVRAQALGNRAGGSKRAKLHRDHGIRLALGLGELARFDLGKGLLDGEAIYQAGRLLNEEKTHDKKRITVKRTLFVNCEDPAIEGEVRPMLALIDELLMRATAKQCEVVYHRLMGSDEKQISAALGRSQSTINQHTTQSGWHAIEEALERFEFVVSNKIGQKETSH